MKRTSTMALAILLPVFAYAHAGMRDIKGTIERVTTDSVVVKRVDGKSETVPLAASTTYRVGRAAGRWEDMRVGSRVVVHLGRDGKAMEIHLPAKK